MKEKLIPKRKIKTKKMAGIKEKWPEKFTVFIFESKTERLPKINQKRKSKEKLAG